MRSWPSSNRRTDPRHQTGKLIGVYLIDNDIRITVPMNATQIFLSIFSGTLGMGRFIVP